MESMWLTQKFKVLSIIEDFFQDNYDQLKQAAINISGGSELWEELLHYTVDEFLRKKNVEDIIKSGGGRFYCVRIMMNSYRSTTSPFYTTYRRPSSELEEVTEHEEEDNTIEIADKIKKEIEKLNWYDKMLFEIFVDEGHTISSLARATGIPRTSISLSINRIRRHIKKNL